MRVNPIRTPVIIGIPFIRLLPANASCALIDDISSELNTLGLMVAEVLDSVLLVILDFWVSMSASGAFFLPREKTTMPTISKMTKMAETEVMISDLLDANSFRGFMLNGNNFRGSMLDGNKFRRLMLDENNCRGFMLECNLKILENRPYIKTHAIALIGANYSN